MRAWDIVKGKKWLCSTCGIVLAYAELYQTKTSGTVMCEDCWKQWADSHNDINDPPMLCDECGRGMIPLEHLTSGAWANMNERFCTGCSSEMNEEDVDQAIGGLLGILEDTDEEG